MKIINVKFGRQVPTDLSKQLRDLADEVDQGVVTDTVVAFVGDGEYQFLLGASLSQSLVLSTLLKASVLDRFKE